MSVSSALCAQKIEIFEIWAFLVKKPGLATKKSEISKFRVFWSKNQVWPPKNVNFQNLGFLEPMALAFFEKIILSLTFLPATPSSPSRTLEGLFELTRRPSRALDSPRALLPELQRYKDTVRCAALSAEVPGRVQQQLTQTLIVRLWKMHLFTTNPWLSKVDRIELS